MVRTRIQPRATLRILRNPKKASYETSKGFAFAAAALQCRMAAPPSPRNIDSLEARVRQLLVLSGGKAADDLDFRSVLSTSWLAVLQAATQSTCLLSNSFFLSSFTDLAAADKVHSLEDEVRQLKVTVAALEEKLATKEKGSLIAVPSSYTTTQHLTIDCS